MASKSFFFLFIYTFQVQNFQHQLIIRFYIFCSLTLKCFLYLRRSAKFLLSNKNKSWKKFPMSAASMSR